MANTDYLFRFVDGEFIDLQSELSKVVVSEDYLDTLRLLWSRFPLAPRSVYSGPEAGLLLT